jgi:hypothetical protein
VSNHKIFYERSQVLLGDCILEQSVFVAHAGFQSYYMVWKVVDWEHFSHCSNCDRSYTSYERSQADLWLCERSQSHLNDHMGESL